MFAIFASFVSFISRSPEQLTGGDSCLHTRTLSWQWDPQQVPLTSWVSFPHTNITPRLWTAGWQSVCLAVFASWGRAPPGLQSVLSVDRAPTFLPLHWSCCVLVGSLLCVRKRS